MMIVKRMKRAIAILFVLFASHLFLFAETWSFDALGIQFRTPDEIVGMTIPDNQIVKHVNAQTPINIFTGNSEKFSITVSAQYSPIETFILVPEDVLLPMMWNDYYSEIYELLGITVSDVSTDKIGIFDAVRYEAVSDVDGIKASLIMYQTVVNQYCLVFAFAADYFNESQLEYFAERVINTFEIIGDGQIPDCFDPTIVLMHEGIVSCPENSSYAYSLPSPGVSIYRDGELIISISESDLYTSFSSSDKAFVKRKDVNNTMFPPEDMALLLEIPVSSISTKNIAGKEWYRIENYGEQDSLVYCRIYNGYMDLYFTDTWNEETLISMLLTVVDAWE